MDIKRFEDRRLRGARDTMVVYDVENAAQAAALAERIDQDDLYQRNLIQTFGPDTLAEARNRGFSAIG